MKIKLAIKGNSSQIQCETRNIELMKNCKAKLVLDCSDIPYLLENFQNPWYQCKSK